MALLLSIITHVPFEDLDVTTVPGCLKEILKLKEIGEKKQG